MSVLKIEQSAWQKILAFVDNVDGEISGLGKVRVVDGDLIVPDVAIFRQEVSGAHSNIETKALAEFQAERVKAGESMKEWVLWWHSHANMGVFFSGTDTNTIEKSTEFPFLVSLVTNKRHETKARLDVYAPIHLMCDLMVEILHDKHNPYTELCKQEIAQKVSIPKPQTGFDMKWGAVGSDKEANYWKQKHSIMDKIDACYISGNYRKIDKLEKLLEEHMEQGVQAGYEYIDRTIDDNQESLIPSSFTREM